MLSSCCSHQSHLGWKTQTALVLRLANLHSRTKVTFIITLYATMRSPSTVTSCSLIHAPLTFRRVFVARSIPCWIASSKLFSDVALISVTRATDIALNLLSKLCQTANPTEASA